VRAIMNSGPVWCGMFCATIFFSGGNLMSLFFLDKAERNWIGRHKFNVMVPYISFIFMMGMGIRNLSVGHIHHDVVSFYMSWVLTGAVFSILFYKLIHFFSRQYKSSFS